MKNMLKMLPRKELITELKKMYKQLGDIPSLTVMIRHGISSYAFRVVFGSYGNALSSVFSKKQLDCRKNKKKPRRKLINNNYLLRPDELNEIYKIECPKLAYEDLNKYSKIMD